MEPSLDFCQPIDLSFTPPSLERYPCLRLAQNALEQGNSAPLVFNAANEVAVDAFLMNRIGFLDISRIIESTLNDFDHIFSDSIDDLLEYDASSRMIASNHLDRIA